jgi:glutamate dehydrogenase
VHRPSHLDYIGLKRFDAQGAVCGEQRLLGLYTSTAYQSNPRTIPLVRRKIERVMTRSGLAPKSHAGKGLLNILETYPRDELFQIGEGDLLQTAMGILHLQERQRVRLFVRRDPFGRFLSCLVYVPRDRYTTELRERIQSILRDAFNGESVDFTVLLSESVLARIHFIVYTRPEALADYDTLEIERKIAKAVRSWRDDLAQALKDAHGEKIGKELLQRYLRAFPAAYREDVDIDSTVLDLDRIEAAIEKGKLQMHLYRQPGAQDRMLQFKLFQPQTPLPLSSVIPMLENMDVMVLSESPYHIRPRGTHSVWIHDFGIEHRETDALDLERIRPLFQEAFDQIWHGRMENDGFNRLILRARLNWRDVLLLRACCKYLLQTRIPFSQTYMEEALANNPNIARLLVEHFHARFDPALQDHGATRSSTLAADIEEAFDSVASLDEDRILRRFFGLIQAILRTNYFQRDDEGKPKEHLALKLAPSLMPELPLPRPMFEIFVYSARVEGVHMRGGKVARGGLRWSDRREDFRTEVLGLMKAQMVKNAVIVPVGAKGGFIVKQAPETGDGQALQTEGISCYQTFIQGLLDLTDNRVGDRIVPPGSRRTLRRKRSLPGSRRRQRHSDVFRHRQRYFPGVQVLVR